MKKSFALFLAVAVLLSAAMFSACDSSKPLPYGFETDCEIKQMLCQSFRFLRSLFIHAAGRGFMSRRVPEKWFYAVE